MTCYEIVSGIDNLRPNTESEQTKKEWINVLETKIAEHMTQFSECEVVLSNEKLLLGEEYRDMYIYYAVSMIDLKNQDIAMYNNSSAFFNDMFTSWKKKWRRENIPKARKKGGV